VTRHQPAVRFIFLTLLLDVLGFGLLIPVGPRLVQELQGAGASPETAARPFGWLAVTFAVMLFVCSPILGSLSDRFGRRPIILISLLGSGIDYFAQALAPSLTILFITRAINGVSGSNMTACNAYIADVTPPDKRAAGFGVIGAAFGLGFVFGPIMGGLLVGLGEYAQAHAEAAPSWLEWAARAIGHDPIRLPFYVAGMLCLLNWAYGWFVLPESLPADRRRPFHLGRSHPIATFMHLTKYPVVLELGAALFLANVAQFGLHATWALYTQHRYGWEAWEVGLSLTVVGIGAAVVQGGLARRLIPAMGEARSVILGFVMAVLAFAGYGWAPQGWMIYVMVFGASLGGIAGPACQSIITKSVPGNEQGETQGAMTALNSFAAIIGPLISTNVFAHFIDKERAVQVPGAPFYVGAGLTVVGLLAVVWALRTRLPAADAGGAIG